MESLFVRNSKKELVPSTIPFYPKVISTLKPTLQKVISKEDLHIVIFFTRSQYEFTKTVLEKEIHTIHDASTNVTISTLDKFPISSKDLEGLLVNQTAKNLLYCFHFLLTPKELKEIVPFTKSRRIGLCAIQYPSFFHVGGSLLYEYPAENIVNFVHTEKENEFLWFIWGTRSNTRSEYMTLSIKQHEMLPRHLEEGLVIKRRLEEGESMESLAREFQMDRSTLHKKVKVAKYLDQYPQLRHFSLNKGLEFVRSLEENNSLSNRGHREPAKRARKEWTKWSDGIPLLSQAAMTLQHVPNVIVSETNSSPLSTSPLSSPLNSIE